MMHPALGPAQGFAAAPFRHRRLLGVPPVRPAEVVIPRRQAQPLHGEGVHRSAAAALAVGDARLTRLDPQLLEPGPQCLRVEEPAVLVYEVGPLQVACGRDMPAAPGHPGLAGVFAPAAGVDDVRGAPLEGSQDFLLGGVPVGAEGDLDGPRRNLRRLRRDRPGRSHPSRGNGRRSGPRARGPGSGAATRSAPPHAAAGCRKPGPRSRARSPAGAQPGLPGGPIGEPARPARPASGRPRRRPRPRRGCAPSRIRPSDRPSSSRRFAPPSRSSKAVYARRGRAAVCTFPPPRSGGGGGRRRISKTAQPVVATDEGPSFSPGKETVWAGVDPIGFRESRPGRPSNCAMRSRQGPRRSCSFSGPYRLGVGPGLECAGRIDGEVTRSGFVAGVGGRDGSQSGCSRGAGPPRRQPSRASSPGR